MDITNRFRKRNFLLRLVVILAMLAVISRAQKTFMRSCDCEYTADGKCAYTLQLPISQTMPIGETCANSKLSTEQLERITSAESKVEQLEVNVKTVTEDTQQNSRILLDMQSKVIALQHSLYVNGTEEDEDVPLTGTSGDTAKVPDGETTSSTSTSELQKAINEITTKIDRQQDAIDSLTEHFNTVADATASVRSDYETLTTGLDDVQSYIERLGNSYEEAKADIEKRQVEIAELRSAIDGIKADGLLCSQKGLLVDGGKANIPDSRMNVSSSFNGDHGPSKARIFNKGNPGAWCPSKY